jgi:hypothetical protein
VEGQCDHVSEGQLVVCRLLGLWLETWRFYVFCYEGILNNRFSIEKPASAFPK